MLLSTLVKPALSPEWSQRVLRGEFHRTALRELQSAWQRAPSAAARAGACLDVVQPLVFRTAQAAVIVADGLLAVPANAAAVVAGGVGGGLGLTLGAMKLVTGQGTLATPAASARAGAALGFASLRNVYAVAVRVGLLCCTLLALVASLPAQLLHLWVARVPPAAPKLADFSPLPANRVASTLRGLEGQGGVLASIHNVRVTHNAEAGRWQFEGEVRALFGTLPVARFTGEVTGDAERARNITIDVPGHNGLNPVQLSFAPSLLHGRLQMTGRAEGFHFWERKPISGDLKALAFTKEFGQWRPSQRAEHGVNESFGEADRYVRFARGLENGRAVQEIIYNGGWRDGFSMGPVELQRFPFGVATKLGMLLHLDS